jgi:hypothetical protein
MNRNTLRSLVVPLLVSVSLLVLPAGPAWAGPANTGLVAAGGSGSNSSLSNWLNWLLDRVTGGWLSGTDDHAGGARAEKDGELLPPPETTTGNPNGGGGGGGGDEGDHGPGVDPNG